MKTKIKITESQLNRLKKSLMEYGYENDYNEKEPYNKHAIRQPEKEGKFRNLRVYQQDPNSEHVDEDSDKNENNE